MTGVLAPVASTSRPSGVGVGTDIPAMRFDAGFRPRTIPRSQYPVRPRRLPPRRRQSRSQAPASRNPSAAAAGWQGAAGASPAPLRPRQGRHRAQDGVRGLSPRRGQRPTQPASRRCAGTPPAAGCVGRQYVVSSNSSDATARPVTLLTRVIDGCAMVTRVRAASTSPRAGLDQGAMEGLAGVQSSYPNLFRLESLHDGFQRRPPGR